VLDLSKPYSIDGDIYTCLECQDFIGKRSGYYKHRKAKHSHGEEGSVSPPSSVSAADTSSEVAEPLPASIDDEESFREEDHALDDDVGQEDEESSDTGEVDDNSSWMNWGTDIEDTANYHMPTPLKAMKKKATKGKRTKRSAKELVAARDTSKNLVVMGLGFSDTLMSAYGRGVTMDKDFKVEHSQRDKELVAEAQVAYMEEKGIFLSDRISKGMVAGAMLVWYHGVPMNDIRKKAKRPLLKRGGGLLKRLPIINRLFRRKKKTTQQTLPVESEEMGVYGL
jgi:hypothetical protein